MRGLGFREFSSNITSKKPPIPFPLQRDFPDNCVLIKNVAWAGWPSYIASIKAPAWRTTWA